MAVSQAQIVDLLYKEAFGVTKTDTASNKSPSNESIPSPLLLRGDTIWIESSSIPPTAAYVPAIVQDYTGTGAIECEADTTTVPIGGIYPTWLTNLTDWIPQEFGATYVVKVYVDNSGAANPTLTGTQIFADGSGNTGQFYFNYVSGVLNFIGETIPAALTSGKVLYVVGYRYVGIKGIQSFTPTTGNITFSGSTISNDVANANITIDPNGTGNFNITGDTSASGNITAAYFIGNGSQLTGLPAGYSNANVSAYLSSGSLTSNIITTADIVSGNITTGNLTGQTIVAGTGSGGNISGANVVSANTFTAAFDVNTANVSATGFVTVTGNVTGDYFIGNGAVLTSVMSDRGGDQNNWNAITQMGVYTVNRVSWSGTTGTPLDSQVYTGILEVKNSTNTAITQVFYPGTIDGSNSQIQWNRSYWSGSWSPWYFVVNNNNIVDAGSF